MESAESSGSGSYQSSNIPIYPDFESMPIFQDEKYIKLLRGVFTYGFQTPSEIQKRAIMPIVMGRNLIAQSQSGTGKTGAFAIGTLALLDLSIKGVQIVVVAPTHELATQTHSVYCELAKYIFPVSAEMPSIENEIVLCVGKQVSVEDNMSAIRKGARILVGTPGRINHLVCYRRGNHSLVDPSTCKVLVIDEADKMLASKDAKLLYDIVKELDDPKRRKDYLQFAIFSATFNGKEALDDARRLCLPNYDDLVATKGDDWITTPGAPDHILLQPDKLTLDGIVQYYFDLNCKSQENAFSDKAGFIQTLNEERMIPTCIIYVRNADTAEHLMKALTSIGMSCQCIYGTMPSSDRMKITRAFRLNEIRVLISTDLLARGFDVRQVALVINFDLPDVFDCRSASTDQIKLADYLHRIGRSGRWGRKGVAINLIATASDRTRKSIIEQHYGVTMLELPDDVSQIY
jgi:superfamily II DNA/RNA helicase